MTSHAVFTGLINLLLGVGLGVAGGVVSVSWGVALAYRFSARRLRLAFCAVLLGTALMMLLVKPA